MKKVICFLLIALMVIALTACGEKSATLSDIDARYESEEFYITPKSDIEGLYITYLLYDESGVVIDTYTKDVGDVIKGKTYKVKATPLFMLQAPASAEITSVTGTIKE